MIDLTKLKVGDTVVLRCGGRILVEQKKHTIYGVTFINAITNWNNNGVFYNLGESALDIIAIEPTPEPRKVVEYAAFMWKDGLYIDSSIESVRFNWKDADKYFKITITEGKKPEIEEVE